MFYSITLFFVEFVMDREIEPKTSKVLVYDDIVLYGADVNSLLAQGAFC